MARKTVRSLLLAVSVAWREVMDDPRRAAELARRVGFPALAVTFAAACAERLSPEPTEAADAWRLGRLSEAVSRLATPRGWRVRRLRARRAAEVQALTRPTLPVRGSEDDRPLAPSLVRGNGLPVHGRILHIVTNSLPYKQAGYTLRTQAIARAQAAAGLQPHVVTRLGFPVAQGVLDGCRLAHIDGVPHHRLLPRVMPAGREAALACNVELAAELVERIQPALLHAATDHSNGRVALALRRRYGIPVVYEVRGFLEETWLTQLPGRTRTSELYRARRELETYCMRAADVVLTLGQTMKEEIASRGIAEDKIVVVPNGVDDAFLQPLPDPSALRARLGIRPGDYVVGTVATLTAHEGIGTLLDAGARLRQRGLPIRLLIVGDGPELRSLQVQAGRLGLDDGAALFTGRIPHSQVREHHALLDVFAVPRTGARVCHLVAPLKPVEAMASGLPVVSTNVKAMGELVEPGVNGQLIPSDDPEIWADALEALFYSPDQRHEFGDAARTRVAEDRTWTHIAGITHGVYRRLGVT